MGKRGPKPKPTALRVLEGNPGRLPLNPDEITCDAPPAEHSIVAMDAHASEEFRRLLSHMPPHLYTALDQALLSAYALAWSMLIKAQQEIDARGLMLELPTYNKDGAEVGTALEINPAVKAWKAASETLIKLTDRLGLSPSVRARLQVPSRGEAPASRFAGLIKQQ